jgi:hypothetical protein
MQKPIVKGARPTFLEELALQRWDDHRYYHQSRINQSLHFFSALCFITAYVFIPINPVVSVMLGWILAMVSRQAGHFFFEPKSFDHVNQATHEHKEAIKVGYNLYRKVWLMSIWLLSPLLLVWDPALFGLMTPHESAYDFLHNTSVLWLVVGAGAVLLRTLYLCLFWNVQSGLVWCTKIITDPFHDAKIYSRAPLALLRGELIDPMHDVVGSP